MTPIQLLLVDDSALFREALRSMLTATPEFEVVGEAANGEEAIESVKRCRPDVVLMDLRMSIMDGVEATRRLCHENAACNVLLLTWHDDNRALLDTLRAGAVGYLLKDAESSDLLRAIRSAARGESFLQPAIATKIVSELARPSQVQEPSTDPLVDLLSKRERDILQFVAEGTSNRDIADRLHLSEGTVKQHLKTIFMKLGARDRANAVAIAKDKSLI